ncbi:uncharacterized protein LOC107732227 isoform X1 [Sinocyclocheilus rhinocerous]|uniref:uncharacterized protein LOC107732227 isoform X1 n=1 Tax=Sinocyclocheilus rhinocerous TaxID=307959 RepID=UPI0007BAC65B|nr:PREDICTED: uncharacterized protein LOC107732227 isoform X1 [Sinocyclocheilus rhinocerous]
MFRCFNLLLLFCLVSYSGTPSIPVKEKKGGIATLSCEVDGKDIIDINLIRMSKNISVCQTEKCSGRIFKNRVCDVVIKDLRFSDAGKYILRFVYKNYPGKTYHLQIHDEVSVKIGEELKLNVLLPNADKVEKNSSGELREVWKRGHGVWSERLSDTDGNLTIKEFTANDAGAYRVLDSEREILITVTVTGALSGTQSKDKLDTDDEQPNGTEQPPAWVWIVIVLVVLVVLGALGLIAFAVIRTHQHQNRNEGCNSYQCVSVEQTVQGPTLPNNSNGYVQSTLSANRSAEDAVSVSFLTE